MIFFLINNNFHLGDVLARVENFKLKDVTIICVPHSLDLKKVSETGLPFIVFKSPLTEKYGCLQPQKFINSLNQIKKNLKPCRNDDIYIYTEYELLNHCVVREFLKKKATIRLIEENGLATYALNKVAHGCNLRSLILCRPKLFLANVFYCGFLTKCYVSGQEVFPVLPDRVFRESIYYSHVSSRREFNVVVEEWKNNKLIQTPSCKNNCVLFLSQDVYNFYMTVDEYVSYLDNVNDSILSKYGKIMFKFHPREVGTKIESIVKERYPHYIFIGSSSPVEELVDDLNPGLVVSFFSSSLINLHRIGWNVMFTLSKWDGLKRNQFLMAIKESLDEMEISC
jgi:hypothetical protein